MRWLYIQQAFSDRKGMSALQNALADNGHSSGIFDFDSALKLI